MSTLAHDSDCDTALCPNSQPVSARPFDSILSALIAKQLDHLSLLETVSRLRDGSDVLQGWTLTWGPWKCPERGRTASYRGFLDSDEDAITLTSDASFHKTSPAEDAHTDDSLHNLSPLLKNLKKIALTLEREIHRKELELENIASNLREIDWWIEQLAGLLKQAVQALERADIPPAVQADFHMIHNLILIKELIAEASSVCGTDNGYDNKLEIYEPTYSWSDFNFGDQPEVMAALNSGQQWGPSTLCLITEHIRAAAHLEKLDALLVDQRKLLLYKESWIEDAATAMELIISVRREANGVADGGMPARDWERAADTRNGMEVGALMTRLRMSCKGSEEVKRKGRIDKVLDLKRQWFEEQSRWAALVHGPPRGLSQHA